MGAITVQIRPQHDPHHTGHQPDTLQELPSGVATHTGSADPTDFTSPEHSDTASRATSDTHSSTYSSSLEGSPSFISQPVDLSLDSDANSRASDIGTNDTAAQQNDIQHRRAKSGKFQSETSFCTIQTRSKTRKTRHSTPTISEAPTEPGLTLSNGFAAILELEDGEFLPEFNHQYQGPSGVQTRAKSLKTGQKGKKEQEVADNSKGQQITQDPLNAAKVAAGSHYEEALHRNESKEADLHVVVGLAAASWFQGAAPSVSPAEPTENRPQGSVPESREDQLRTHDRKFKNSAKRVIPSKQP